MGTASETDAAPEEEDTFRRNSQDPLSVKCDDDDTGRQGGGTRRGGDMDMEHGTGTSGRERLFVWTNKLISVNSSNPVAKLQTVIHGAAAAASASAQAPVGWDGNKQEGGRGTDNLESRLAI